MSALQEEVKAMLSRQFQSWNLAARNYRALEQVLVKDFDVSGIRIRAQFNPARIISSGAKVDSHSIRQRRCFLCPEHLPENQLHVPFGRYWILCNPYPIFREHLTIPAIVHAPQEIQTRIDDFLLLARQLPGFTLFYNGPKCGASAPDHAHFQAAPFGIMPMDKDIDSFLKLVYQEGNSRLFLLTHYLRNGLVIESDAPEEVARLFHLICQSAWPDQENTEPMMNLFVHFRESVWRLVIIFRKKHRPWQYEANDEHRFLSSPGAADIGGLFVTVRKEDFECVNESLLRNIFGQVCLSDNEINELFQNFVRLQKNHYLCKQKLSSSK